VVPVSRLSGVGTVVVAILMVTSVSFAFVGTSGTASAATKKADVVFVFDKTGSMDEEAAALKDEIKSVAADLESKGIDTRYALIEYESASNTDVTDFSDEVSGTQAFTGDTAELEDALAGFTTGGGTEDASPAIRTALGLDYRDDAKKVIVVLTDEDDDGYTDENGDGQADVVDAVNEAGACLLSVSPDEVDTDPPDQLKTYSEQVDCGDWSDILSESFSTVVQDLITFIDETVSEGTEDDSVPSPRFEVVERSVNETELYTDETANVTYVVENVGSADGIYHAFLYDNDRSLASERVEIETGERHTFHWEVSWATEGKRDLRTKDRYIARVDVSERPTPTLDPADVEVLDASVDRSHVVAGERYEVGAEIRNDATSVGKAPVVYARNGTEVANHSIELAGGERAEDSATVTASAPTTPGNVSWAVNGVSADNVTVLDPNATESGVIDVYATKSTVAPNESYEVVPVVYNGGTSSQVFYVSLTRAGETTPTVKQVTVAPGETAELAFAVVAPDSAGTDGWVVNGETGPSVTVTNATAS